MFWILAPNPTPDYDRYSVYVENPKFPDDGSTVQIIAKV